MKDTKCRTELEFVKQELRDVKEALSKLEEDSNLFLLRDTKRALLTLVKELGFSFDTDGVFDNDAKPNSALGKLQTQITALVNSLNLVETYTDGHLEYREEGQKSRRS